MCQKASEYDQEMPQLQTIDQPTTPRERETEPTASELPDCTGQMTTPDSVVV